METVVKHLMKNSQNRVKVFVDNKDIKYMVINGHGRICETGEIEEESDTFMDTFVDIKSLEVGKKLILTFNKINHTDLNYITTKIQILA